MLFGLCNQQATFHWLMERVFGAVIGENVLVYLDEVFIFIAPTDVPFQTIDQIFGLLIQAKLKCKSSKSALLTDIIHYLGHVVNNASIWPKQNKLDRIQQWPLPTTGGELASFLGLCNYYRKLVQSFADVCYRLYKLSRATKIQWSNN